ncbi:DUF421 domain-containing protein [Reyranella sp.]|uniref:DUF421 domain-containing protein n=1 Tax=Reyranella sp. TaxID=1929291 RepID=UPI003F723481
MPWLSSIDWRSIFMPELGVAELLVRGVLMYSIVFVLLRLVLRRNVGGIGTMDVLVIVLVSELAGQGFLPDSRSIVDSAIVILVILSCSYTIEWLQYRFPAFERLTREPKLKLIEDGHLLRQNMRREFVTEEELMAQIREKGCEDCREIKAAYIEADGRISIIKR